MIAHDSSFISNVGDADMEEIFWGTLSVVVWGFVAVEVYDVTVPHTASKWIESTETPPMGDGFNAYATIRSSEIDRWFDWSQQHFRPLVLKTRTLELSCNSRNIGQLMVTLDIPLEQQNPRGVEHKGLDGSIRLKVDTIAAEFYGSYVRSDSHHHWTVELLTDEHPIRHRQIAALLQIPYAKQIDYLAHNVIERGGGKRDHVLSAR
jgi:hypothetical protein